MWGCQAGGWIGARLLSPSFRAPSWVSSSSRPFYPLVKGLPRSVRVGTWACMALFHCRWPLSTLVPTCQWGGCILLGLFRSYSACDYCCWQGRVCLSLLLPSSSASLLSQHASLCPVSASSSVSAGHHPPESSLIIVLVATCLLDSNGFPCCPHCCCVRLGVRMCLPFQQIDFVLSVPALCTDLFLPFPSCFLFVHRIAAASLLLPSLLYACWHHRLFQGEFRSMLFTCSVNACVGQFVFFLVLALDCFTR